MGSNFTVNQADLQFILDQIIIGERHAAGEALTDIIGPDAHILPRGLRAVDGSNNNLLPGQSHFGAADQPFPRLVPPEFRDDADGDTMPLGPGVTVTNTDYGASGNVADADPRIISNLIVDQTNTNPAAVQAWYDNPLAIAAYQDAHGGALPPDGYVPTNEELGIIANQSPDIGLSPGFNGWFTFFGQFFDHGLDLVTKANNGTVFIPLQPDDPLIAGADHILGNADDLPPELRFMVLTRAQPVNGTEGINTTTPFVDQNQTYTSHPSHQVFLREYALDADGHPVSTGRLLDGHGTGLDANGVGTLDGAIANWGEVKAQAAELLGIHLSDFDVHDVPLLATDAYGRFIPGAHGFPQIVTAHGLVEGDPAANGGLGIDIPADAVRTGHAFLNDIAHHAAPGLFDPDNNPATNNSVRQTADADPGVGDDGDPSTYDDEMLNSHFVTGDGRGNENIGLTAVHTIFHSEHNRLVEDYKQTILASGDLDFINQWVSGPPLTALPDAGDTINWDGERLFQAGRFVTEMQYQHLVFEEFARAVQPNVDPFVFSNSADIDPAIVAEFAHAVYRFGHSMLTDTVARFDNDLTPGDDVGLIEAFLNPQEFITSGVSADIEEATGAIIRGMARQTGNEIDEFVVEALRNNLLGLPLDLPALNIARGRDTGIPTFNHIRAQFYAETGDAQLKPYVSWLDYAQNIKHPLSIINFIAAYGTHDLITQEATTEGKRAAALAIVLGQDQVVLGDPNTAADDRTIVAPTDRIEFLGSSGTWAGRESGLNDVDLWIGGLAEEKMEFGGMLGSTFNYVFENQMERLQNGDRFYYLSRLQGTNLLNQLEPNTFAELVMRNTDLGRDHSTHLSGALFGTPDLTLELDPLVRQVTGLDPDGTPNPLGTADPIHDDPILQAIDPKVVRVAPGVDVDGDGQGDGGMLKFSGGEHVVLGGTEGNDTLLGDKGIDTLWGDGGNDFLNAGMESDQVFGGDGNDIIIDPFGDDLLRGEDGDDVISAGPGLDITFGGNGNDFILSGADANEVFAGIGNDFVIGDAGGDSLLGNEGDDWLEGGEGFDTLTGENSELFFNSPIVGHDVMWGGENDTDYDGESGDDIMVQGPGIQRNEGMFGFDWAIHQNNVAPADTDMRLRIVRAVEPDVLRDRFDSVEGLSGWNLDDNLIGDDRITNLGFEGVGEPLGPADTPLTQAGIDRIAGLQAVVGAGVTSFDGGNIILGGLGSDRIQGGGGNDIIDGDKWLNVRISVRDIDNPGVEIETTDTMLTLEARMLSGALSPSQLVIVREILDADDPDGVDTALFSGNRDEYTITDNGDGTITVAHTGGTGFDGVDTLSNIERLQFLDQIIPLSGGPFNSGPPTGTPLISDGTPTEGTALTVSLTNLGDPDGVDLTSASFQWQQLVGATWQNIGGATNSSFAPGQDQVGLSLRVLVDYLDLGGNAEHSESDPTNVVGDLFTGTPAADVWIGTGGSDNASGNGAADDLRGINGDDILSGGDGNDLLRGGTGIDTMSGGAGNDTFYVDSGSDVVNEAAGQGTLDRVLADVSYTLAAGAEVEVLSVRLRGGTTDIDLTGNALNNRLIGNNGTNVLDGAGGDDYLLGNGAGDILEGGDGVDRLRGLLGDDILIGGAGNDVIRGDDGNDTIVLEPGFGNDRAFGFDSDPAGGQDLIDVSALGITAGTFADDVTILQSGATTLIRIGADSIRLDVAAVTIDATDFLFA